MNKNQITLAKDYKFDKPLSHKTDSIVDNCNRDCVNKYFHTLEYECVYEIKLTNIKNIEKFTITISDKCMGLFEIKKIEICSTKRF